MAFKAFSMVCWQKKRQCRYFLFTKRRNQLFLGIICIYIFRV